MKADVRRHLPEFNLQQLRQVLADAGQKRLTTDGRARVAQLRAQGVTDIREVMSSLIAADRAGQVRCFASRNPKATHLCCETLLRRSDPMDPEILSKMVVVPLSAVRARVAKYDVVLREAPLQATRAMHTILTRMLMFRCWHCNARFPTFHPAYDPTEALELELCRLGSSGLAACDVQVAVWDDFPVCLLYTSPSPRDVEEARMPSSA